VVGHRRERRSRIGTHVAGVDDPLGARRDGGVDSVAVPAHGLLPGAVHRDDEHGGRPLEGVAQAGRVVEVAWPDPDAALLQAGELLRIAGAGPELIGRHVLQQVVEDGAAQLAACPGNDDHVMSFPVITQRPYHWKYQWNQD
jgi:hypothetical protein